MTEGSFDAYLWQTVARKAAFIGQLMRPVNDVRQLDGDVGEAALSYDEVKALASGNPLLLEHAQAEVRRLERLESSHYANQSYLARRAELGKTRIPEMQGNLAAFAQAKAALSPHFELLREARQALADGAAQQADRPKAAHRRDAGRSLPR